MTIYVFQPRHLQNSLQICRSGHAVYTYNSVVNFYAKRRFTEHGSFWGMNNFIAFIYIIALSPKQIENETTNCFETHSQFCEQSKKKKETQKPHLWMHVLRQCMHLPRILSEKKFNDKIVVGFALKKYHVKYLPTHVLRNHFH